MRKNHRELIWHHTPLLFAAAILGLHSLDGYFLGSGRIHRAVWFLQFFALPGAFLALILQLGLWLRMSRRRFGAFQTLAMVAVLAVLVVGSARLHDEGEPPWQRELILHDRMPYPGYEHESFTVSPDDRWIVYWRGSSLATNGDDAEMALVFFDRETLEERIIDIGCIPDRRAYQSWATTPFGLSLTIWNDLGLVLYHGRADAYVVDVGLSAARPMSDGEFARVHEAFYDGKILRALWDVSQQMRRTNVSWDGSTFGSYRYSTSFDRGSIRNIGHLERSDPDGVVERLITQRGMFSDWNLSSPAVSPDGRLVAFSGFRSPHWAPYLQMMIPYLAFGSIDFTHLLVFDVQKGAVHDLGRIQFLHCYRWSGDSRRLYFDEFQGDRGVYLSAIEFAIGPTSLEEERLKFDPTSPRLPPERKPIEPVRELVDTYGDWASLRFGYFSVRYPSPFLQAHWEDEVLVLEHMSQVRGGDGGELIDGKGSDIVRLELRLSEVNGNFVEVAPEGATPYVPRASGGSFTCRTLRVEAVEGDSVVETFYSGQFGDRTQIVTLRYATDDSPHRLGMQELGPIGQLLDPQRFRSIGIRVVESLIVPRY